MCLFYLTATDVFSGICDIPVLAIINAEWVDQNEMYDNLY